MQSMHVVYNTLALQVDVILVSSERKHGTKLLDSEPCNTSEWTPTI